MLHVSWQEEFREAADLLSRVLGPKVKSDEKRDIMPCLERNGSTQRHAQGRSLLAHNPAAVTVMATDVHADRHDAVLTDSLSNSPDCNFVYNSSASSSEEQSGSIWTKLHQLDKKPDILVSRIECFSSFSSKAVGLNGSHVQTKLESWHLADEEQGSESDDELEQFVFQPKCQTQRNVKFWFTITRDKIGNTFINFLIKLVCIQKLNPTFFDINIPLCLSRGEGWGEVARLMAAGFTPNMILWDLKFPGSRLTYSCIVLIFDRYNLISKCGAALHWKWWVSCGGLPLIQAVAGGRNTWCPVMDHHSFRPPLTRRDRLIAG